MSKQFICRKGTFDAGHRVMNERMKCFNIHGHTYSYELVFSFNTTLDIGYNIDFKEIKRIGCQWIDDYLDHASIINPQDKTYIEFAQKLESKFYIMSLNKHDYCNPTVENIAKEIFLSMEILFSKFNGLYIHSVILYETPNCYTTCYKDSITKSEEENFRSKYLNFLSLYRDSKGIIEYDDRKI